MKILLIIFFLASFSSPKSNIKSNYEELDFHNDLSYNEFKSLLIIYATNNDYPEIN
jgi:hypothetical protein